MAIFLVEQSLPFTCFGRLWQVHQRSLKQPLYRLPLQLYLCIL